MCSARLWQARVKPDGTWSNRCGATFEELNDGARVDVAAKLKELGATNIGTKADLFADNSKNRNHLYVSFRSDNTQVALASYCLTTVLPLLNDYGLRLEPVSNSAFLPIDANSPSLSTAG
jgi:hypothetical protein